MLELQVSAYLSAAAPHLQTREEQWMELRNSYNPQQYSGKCCMKRQI